MIDERLAMITVNGHRLAAAVHDAGGSDIVLFCHGFGGTKTGPHRFFVRAARVLSRAGISALRFDQYGCGDSEGEFIDSSFDDWVATTTALARRYLEDGFRVVLFGQSMGGATVIVTAAVVPAISAVVAWVPDPNVGPFGPSPGGFSEEGGQLIGDGFWREAHGARVADRFRDVAAPAYLVFGTDDELVSTENREALISRAKASDRIDVFDGYLHSAWSYDQATEVIERSCAFILAALPADR